MIKYSLNAHSQDMDLALRKALYNAAAALDFDILVTCVFRCKFDQDTAYANGKSKLKYPHSAHNKRPCKAFDMCPMLNGNLLWQDIEKFNKVREEISKHVELKPVIRWDIGHMEMK